MGGKLAGVRLIIIEDETLVGLWFEELVEEWGCEVLGWATTVESAERLVLAAEADAALLDLNLDGTSTAEIGAALKARNIPFVVVTGYGSGVTHALPIDAPIVRKPVDPKLLRAALLQVLASRGAAAAGSSGSALDVV
jgi:DNA-binding response OmpR family regulator